MKRGAVVAVLAAVVLLALVWAQRWTVGSCDFEQKIITPDGMEFVFEGPRIAPGSPDLDWPLDGGEGLPPIEHLSQEIYGMPGALLKGTVVKPRVLTITLTTHGITRKALMDIKAKMQGALRWDRGDPGDPSIYRYTMNGVSRDLYVHYDSDVRRSVGRPGLTEVIGVRMIAYDPMWYDPDTEEQVLDWEDTMLVRLVSAKVGGLWDNLGPPAAVAAGAGGNTNIQAIAISPDGDYVYYGGDFQNFDNIPAADHVVRRNLAAGTWEAVGGGLNDQVRALRFGPDGILYAGGAFTNGSGGAGDAAADYVAQLDTLTNTWVNVGGGPGAGAVTTVYDLTFGHDGTLYLGGIFTNWNGIAAADYIVSLPLPYATGAWASLGAGALSLTVRTLTTLPTGNIVAGGDFALIGAAPFLRIAEWDPVAATWSALGSGLSNNVYTLCVGADGALYAGGFFLTTQDASVTLNMVGRWNGTSWSPMGDGLGAQVVKLVAHPNGNIYASGAFVNAGGVPFADRIARWNGFAWIPLDIILPVTVAYAPRFAISPGGDLYIGSDALAVNVPCGADNAVMNGGNAFTLPIIEIKNAGLVGQIINEAVGGSQATKREIPCNMQIQDGEIITLDLSSGVKSCESTWRGNRLNDILPASDMATFCLESAPRAQYGGVAGSNLITVFITDADPRESGDNNNQLSGWENITGISQDNTDYGRLYAVIIFDGVDYHTNLYTNPDRIYPIGLVAYTDDYAAPGVKVLHPFEGSGLGGTITVDAVVAADADIEVWFTIVTMFYRNRWWDLDAAVS